MDKISLWNSFCVNESLKYLTKIINGLVASVLVALLHTGDEASVLVLWS